MYSCSFVAPLCVSKEGCGGTYMSWRSRSRTDVLKRWFWHRCVDSWRPTIVREHRLFPHWNAAFVLSNWVHSISYQQVTKQTTHRCLRRTLGLQMPGEISIIHWQPMQNNNKCFWIVLTPGLWGQKVVLDEMCWYLYVFFLLSTGYGECLLDEPSGRTYNLPNQLPGQLYNANRQCELMFGPGSQVCPFMVRHLNLLRQCISDTLTQWPPC